MAHKTLIGGTAYEVTGGKCLVGGTSYSISKGRTCIGGTNYDISFIKGFNVTFKVGQGAEWAGWPYGHDCEYYYQTYGYESYIQYSLDGGSTWIDVPPDTSKTANSTITTLTEVSTIMFKCYVESGVASFATVGTTYSGNEIVPYVSPGTETISEEITLTADTTFYLALAYSTAY